MASSFIVERLTGQYVLDHHSASQCDPLYDIHENRWIEEWAGQVAPGLELPRLLWPAEIAGYVTEGAAALTGLPAGIPVAAGTIDAWAEALSVGVSEPGDMMLMYGTTMFLIEVQREALVHPSLWSTAGVFAGTHTLAAGMATSGALTAWVPQLTGNPPYETLLAEAQQVAPGRSEEHTSELQSHSDLVCRLLLEKKKETLRDCDHDLHRRTAATIIAGRSR